MVDYMRNARALYFAAEEGFWHNSCRSSILRYASNAYGKGGAFETIRPIRVEKATGVFSIIKMSSQ